LASVYATLHIVSHTPVAAPYGHIHGALIITLHAVIQSIHAKRHLLIPISTGVLPACLTYRAYFPVYGDQWRGRHRWNIVCKDEHHLRLLEGVLTLGKGRYTLASLRTFERGAEGAAIEVAQTVTLRGGTHTVETGEGEVRWAGWRVLLWAVA